jgi:hypothetical protein
MRTGIYRSHRSSSALKRVGTGEKLKTIDRGCFPSIAPIRAVTARALPDSVDGELTVSTEFRGAATIFLLGFTLVRGMGRRPLQLKTTWPIRGPSRSFLASTGHAIQPRRAADLPLVSVSAHRTLAANACFS